MDNLKDDLQCQLEKLEEMRQYFKEEIDACEDPEDGYLYHSGIVLCDRKIATICKRIEYLERGTK